MQISCFIDETFNAKNEKTIENLSNDCSEKRFSSSETNPDSPPKTLDSLKLKTCGSDEKWIKEWELACKSDKNWQGFDLKGINFLLFYLVKHGLSLLIEQEGKGFSGRRFSPKQR